MTKFLLGTKLHMTQVFDAEGRVHPATILSSGGVTVIRAKMTDTDGYGAVVVGMGEQKKERVNKAQQPQGLFKHIKEFRVDDSEDTKGFTKDAMLDVSVFEPGDTVMVSAISKGKGFQGVVKRHGFKGGPRTHGQKHSERKPGSIGSTGPQKVLKGVRMAGRMGGERVTVKNLKVLEVNKGAGLLVVSGAVPGRRGTVVEIRGTGSKKNS